MKTLLQQFVFKRMSGSEWLRLIFWPSVIATLLTILPFGQWTDLASHFKVYYACFGLLSFFGFMKYKKRALAFLALLIIPISLADIIPLYGQVPKYPYRTTIKIVQVNVNSGNRHYQKTLDYIHKEKPDIISLQEVTQAWVHALSVLRTEYPYRVINSREDTFGIALFSKYPLAHVKIHSVSPRHLPTVYGQLYVNNTTQPLSIISTHPLPPVFNYDERNQQLEDIARLAKRQQNPVMVIGDLNITPYSPEFKKLIEVSKLKNSLVGFGTQASWPSILLFAGIPIDHVLLSPTLTAIHRETGPSVGSDHLPVSITIGLPSKK